MRKITKEAIKAFNEGKRFSKSNTTVTIGNKGGMSEGQRCLYLFGNLIAVKQGDNFEITTAGWNTPTTCERLNEFPNVHCGISKGELYLNNHPWDGEWIEIKNY